MLWNQTEHIFGMPKTDNAGFSLCENLNNLWLMLNNSNLKHDMPKRICLAYNVEWNNDKVTSGLK